MTTKDPIAQAGDPVLRKKAKPVTKKEFGSAALKKLIAGMKKALAKEHFGVALAAPQVGVSLRLFIVAGRAFVADEKSEPSQKNTPPDMVFINPELIRVSRKKREMSEGCLSVRGTYGAVMRNEKASVRAQDEQGEKFLYHGNGLIAHIFQHELDHLEGVLYTDKAKKVVRDEDLKK